MNANNQELQILLVEDNPADAELTMDALRDAHLINCVQWVKDGAEALDVLFGETTSAAESLRLKLVLLDLRLRAWTDWKYCAACAPTNARDGCRWWY